MGFEGDRPSHTGLARGGAKTGKVARAIPSDTRKRLDHQAALLDADIIIKSFGQPELKDTLFPFLEELFLAPTVTSEICFEFLRSASFPETHQKRTSFIKNWTVLPVAAEDRDIAVHIGRIYQSYGLTPSLTDCISAAILRKFPKRLFLVTLNHKDFPPFLFERLHADVIDTRTPKGVWDMLVWGVYAFDEAKYRAEARRLEGLRAA